MHSIDIFRQRYLDLIHRYLQGRLDYVSFLRLLRSQWAEEREEIWPLIWQTARSQYCLERQRRARGESPCAEPTDPRRFPRMLDRLCTLCIEARKEAPFRASVAELLYAYRCPGSVVPEARFIGFPPRIAVFERPLPPGGNHRYPCTVEDIRAQLALVPEYDLEGLRSVGLSPRFRDNGLAYGTYYRWTRPTGRPMILLYSVKGTGEYKLRARYDPHYVKRWYDLERSYGIEFERIGSYVICRWSVESGRRFIAKHVLLHEIGHHVQYQQRWRTGLRRWLPSHIQEQFADDYALRYERELQE